MNNRERLANALGRHTDPEGAPTYYDLLVSESLYARRVVTPEWNLWLSRLWWGDFQFDAHCTGCRKQSTFRSSPVSTAPTDVSQATKFAHYSRLLVCQRHGHNYIFHFSIELALSENKVPETILVKTGQYPSIQDIAGADLLPFRSVLDDLDYSELNKATGLYSHGIGSFVYLRRIFERMIAQHRTEHEALVGEAMNWSGLRMDEKIETLRNELPKALVENRKVYGILSKGIHDLSEEQCKALFPVVRAAIILMLQQALDARQRKLQEEALKAEIDRAATDIRQLSSRESGEG